jgi:hypothetical protein
VSEEEAYADEGWSRTADAGTETPVAAAAPPPLPPPPAVGGDATMDAVAGVNKENASLPDWALESIHSAVTAGVNPITGSPPLPPPSDSDSPIPEWARGDNGAGTTGVGGGGVGGMVLVLFCEQVVLECCIMLPVE